MAEVEELIKKRSKRAQNLNYFLEYINETEHELKNNLSLDDDKLQSMIIETESRLGRIEKSFDEFEKIQDQIDDVIEDEVLIGEQRAISQSFTSDFHKYTAKAKVIIANITKVQNLASVNNQPSQKIRTESIQLPTIPLPQFDGMYSNWIEFRDKFKSLIHNNGNINKIQKYHYLRQSLVGKAEQCIKSIQFGEEYYDSAWEALGEKYNNNQKLIDNHVKAIFEYELAGRATSAKLNNFVDDLNNHVQCLAQLGEPVQHWDRLIIYTAVKKLDTYTQNEWKKHKKSLANAPTFKTLTEFIKSKADLLEDVEDGRTEIDHFKKRDNKDQKYHSRGFHTHTNTSNSSKQDNKNKICLYCKKDHLIYYCSEFSRLTIRERQNSIKELNVCFNCLRGNHQVKECRYTGCKVCQEKHNTLLHSDAVVDSVNPKGDSVTCTFSTDSTIPSSDSLLSTALVKVKDSNNKLCTGRALLDCGSQSSFITTQFCERLKLPLIKTNLTISGMNNTSSFAKHKCNLTLHSIYNSFYFNITCFVIDEITGHLPENKVESNSLKIPIHLQLADPKFDTPAKIDILIGVDAFWGLMGREKLSLGPNSPILQNTKLGWIVAGPINFPSQRTHVICNFNKNSNVTDALVQFWEVEEIANKKPYSDEEIKCEEHFVQHLSRDISGKFVVSIPFKESIEQLGGSKEAAIKRFHHLEKRLLSNEKLYELYFNFLMEYLELGHMTLENNESDEIEYYMPHHGVLRETSLTTKLRVVFNASAATTSGYSLNDLQMTGPVIQDELVSKLLRFRFHAIIISSDIKMMYRCVFIEPSQRSLQKIIWRAKPNENLATYRLNTVTYGTKAASFLAIRCLHELANKCECIHPDIASIIRNDMYVDDLLTGADSPEEALRIANEISQILGSAGFELSKWRSNAIDILRESGTSKEILEFHANKDLMNSKILGLSWVCDSDCLIYKIDTTESNQTHTKRSILSRIATIYDPLGLLSPCIMIAKTLLQKVWMEKLSWDQSLPAHIERDWTEFQSALSSLNELQINRRVICDKPEIIEIHGFSDASERAYGCCVYIKSSNANGEILVNLLISKSKVSPLKVLTMPRLELLGALTLARLIDKVIKSLRMKISNIVYWSDSTIVLGRLRAPPHLLKPFIDNRVAEIQNLTKDYQWRHVPTNDNPADLVSRGISPKFIAQCDTWWKCPSWLMQDESFWPTLPITLNELTELRKVTLATAIKYSFPFEQFSQYLRLRRSMAYILRFIHNCRQSRSNRILGVLTVTELDDAYDLLLKLAQHDSFAPDISRLKNGQSLKATSKILSLNPFLDDKGILRVGGRLENSHYSYNKRHPVLLASDHNLSKLIFKYEHLQLLHAGPQLLLSHIRETIWVVNFDPSTIPKETFELYIFGGKEINFAPKTLNSLSALSLVLMNGTRRIVMEKKSFFDINSSSLLIQIFNCDELVIRTGAFEYVKSSVSTEVADVKHVIIEESAFSKLSSSIFKNVKKVSLCERSFDFKSQGNIGRHGPVTYVLFDNVLIPEIPQETFSKALASVMFYNSEIGDLHTDAFKASEISAVVFVNTTLKNIREGAFTDRTLIFDFKISRCSIQKLQSNCIKAAIGNFTLDYSTIMDIETEAMVSTVAKVEIIGNQISNLQSSGFVFNNWNRVAIEDNIVKDLRVNFINVTNHAEIDQFSFKGNEIYNVEQGALSFLSVLDDKVVIFDDNFFNQSCNCSIDKWLEGVTNSSTKFKIAMDTSFCTVNEFLSNCFSLPVGIINIQNFTEKTCSNLTKCEPYEGKTRVINTTSRIFVEEDNSDKQHWLFLIITIIGLFILATVVTFIILLVRGSRWLKEKGYFRNMHYNNNDLSNEEEGTIVTIDENEKLEIPEELTLEFLQTLSKRLDDPVTHQEASEMIERLYEMFIVDDSYENNNRDEDAHLYEELGNLNLQIPPPPYEEEREPSSNGARSILKLMEEKFNLQPEDQGTSNKRPALMGEYSEPSDAAVHLYSELKNRNEKSESHSSSNWNSSPKHTLGRLPDRPVDNFTVKAGPSTKL